MGTELIVGLDVDTADDAFAAVQACSACSLFKVGSQLFTRCGPNLVQDLQDSGKRIFLDLKFHDIPNTVAGAARAAAELGVDLFTIHATGGRRMIEAARSAIEDTQTKILAVTILTSLSDAMLAEEIGLDEPAAEAVPRLAQMAVESGAHGVVCSPREIRDVREAVGPGAVIVTPGVRPAWAERHDQVRTMTPGEAARAGADFIVVVRPILRHANPAHAVERILKELEMGEGLM